MIPAGNQITTGSIKKTTSSTYLVNGDKQYYMHGMMAQGTLNGNSNLVVDFTIQLASSYAGKSLTMEYIAKFSARNATASGYIKNGSTNLTTTFSSFGYDEDQNTVCKTEKKTFTLDSTRKIRLRVQVNDLTDVDSWVPSLWVGIVNLKVND